MHQVTLNGPQNGLYVPQSQYGSGVPIIRIDDFQVGSSRRYDELRRVSVGLETAQAYALQEGDLLINRVNSPSHLGKSLHVKGCHLPSLFESNMMRLGISGLVDVEFVGIYLQSYEGRKRLISGAKWAVNQASINQGDVLRTPIPLPPLAEQKRIVAEVQRLLSIVQNLDTYVEASLRRAKNLRQAILQQAFTGKLVPSDADVEPAAVLLERIRKNREATAESRPRRGRGIKPGVLTPGPKPSNGPKPRRGAGSDLESACAPSGLLGDLDAGSLGLKPQALRPGPVGAETSDGDASALLHLSGEQQTRVIWEHLVGMGPLHRDDAIRTVAGFLRYRGLIASDYLQNGSVLWHAIANAIDFGVKKGLFDRPRRGEVRALLPDVRDYSLELWSLCLLVSMDFRVIDEDQALRAAAEEARKRMGLKFERLRSDGVILQGLREALEDEVRQGHLRRHGGKIWLTPVEELEKLMDSGREP